MTATLILLLVIGHADGSTTEIEAAAGLTYAQCDAAQHAVWATDRPIVAWDAMGPVYSVDAACVTRAETN